MLLNFSDEAPLPIIPQLKARAQQIEKENPSLQVLAARFYRYPFLQAVVNVYVNEARPITILEEFIVRSTLELSPTPTVNELATELGLDSLFVQYTFQELVNLGVMQDSEINQPMKLTTQGCQFYELNSIPKPLKEEKLFINLDFITSRVSFHRLAKPSLTVDYPNLETTITLPKSQSDPLSLTLEDIQYHTGLLDLHVPTEGRLVTAWKLVEPYEVIYQELALFVLADRVEDRIELQVQREQRPDEEVTQWLRDSLDSQKVSLMQLCGISLEDADKFRRYQSLETPEDTQRVNILKHQTGVEIFRDRAISQVFQDTLKQAHDSIIIFSPWVSEAVVDKKFIKLLKECVQRGVWVTIGWGISRRREDEDRPIPQSVEQALKQIKTPEGLPAVQVHWLGNSHAKEVVVDRKIYLNGSQNFLSYRGEYLPRGELCCKFTDPALVEEGHKSLSLRFSTLAEKLAMEEDLEAIQESFCLWTALDLSEKCIQVLERRKETLSLGIYFDALFHNLRSRDRALSTPKEYINRGLALLDKVDQGETIWASTKRVLVRSHELGLLSTDDIRKISLNFTRDIQK